MSMQQSTVRTNYFRVVDADGFERMMSHVIATEDKVSVFTKEIGGIKKYAFGAYSSIAGVDEALYCQMTNTQSDDLDDDEYTEGRYNAFIVQLQDYVAEGDAVILMEAGHEKLCYIFGDAEIITRTEHEYVSLTDIAVDRARGVLGDSYSDWETQMDY